MCCLCRLEHRVGRAKLLQHLRPMCLQLRLRMQIRLQPLWPMCCLRPAGKFYDAGLGPWTHCRAPWAWARCKFSQ